MENIGIMPIFSIILVTTYGIKTFTEIRVLPKIKEHNPELYKKILGKLTQCWLERGYFSAADLPMYFRLQNAIADKNNIVFVGNKQRILYIISIWLFQFFGIILASIMILFLVVGIFSILMNGI